MPDRPAPPHAASNEHAASDKDHPLVSVIIPAYNASAFIEETLDSARTQTYQNLEILVVDDGSQDETPQIVEAAAAEDARVRLLRQKNQGVAAARNHAIEASSGEFIAPLDADDLWFSEKIERQVERMQRGSRPGEPKLGLVYTWWFAIDEENGFLGASDEFAVEGRALEALIYQNFIGNASIPLFRKECLDDVGGYDPSLKERNGQGCEDWDLTLRVAERYALGVVPEHLVCYRGVENSMSNNCASMARSYELVMRGLSRRHPEIPQRVYAWSRSHYYFYLVGLCYNTGDHAGVLRYAWEGLRADPAAVLSPWLAKIVLKSLVGMTAESALSLAGASQDAWLEFRRSLGDNEQEPREIDVTAAPSSASSTQSPPKPWALKPWKPYDWISMQRWQRLTAGTTNGHRPRATASPPAE